MPFTQGIRDLLVVIAIGIVYGFGLLITRRLK